MNRRLFMIIALALLVCFAMPGISQAARGDREELNFGYVNTASARDDITLVSKPAYIYAVTIFPAQDLAYVLLYDSSDATLQGDLVRVEITESAAYATTREVFNPPIRMTSGIYADVTNGSVIVEYR